ncbi:CS1-pili formation C-terminal domain-containing protein [Erwinia sp. HDF1-3R]|uniref:CS1-pili formation C-terminal domain-containing protein n=1 Tax=Erwinia sp. HDF1-3R TaxID=3141543 RepID=UPI0031F57BAE
MDFSRFITGFTLLLGITVAMQATAAQSPRSLSLAKQAAAMPEDFRAYFFNVPLSARVMLDGKLLGDASIVLSEDERVQLINFTDVSSSEWNEAERQRWLKAMYRPVALGQCNRQCPAGLLAADYNLASAQLTLVTAAHRQSARQQLWHALPEKSSTGLMLSHQLNLSSAQKQSTAVSWLGGLEAAVGNWSVIGQYQLERSQGGKAETRHALTSLYLLRESQHTFYRGGLFSPDSQGVLRQPYSRGSGITTLAGVMTGSSDTLMKKGSTPALYPVWVTANREGVAEIYRNGVLINSQPVQPGLQALDTTPLPEGIYDVEVRVLEDGRETGRSNETVNKPAGWRNPDQRLRYNLFAGQQTVLANNARSEPQGKIAAGASLNYLIRPRLTGGAAVLNVGKETQAGASLDWQASQQVKLYSSLWHSSVTGYGFDSQAMWTHEKGSVALNHSRSWYMPEDAPGRRTNYSRPLTAQNSSLFASYRLDSERSVNTRLTHRSSNNGIGVDAGYSTRLSIGGTPVNLRLDAFDRPYRDNSNTRNRGVALSVSFSPGTQRRSVSVSIGSRMDARGGHDAYASATLNQEWENSIIKQSSVTATADRYGAGLSSYNQFDAPLASGSFWGQRSSAGGLLSGGVNLGSTLAIGQGKGSLGHDAQQHQGGGMIVDVASDDASAELVAYHESGATPLKPGRNFIPVPAWKPGTVQIAFPGKEAPALKASPQYLDYHLVRGGVSSHEVRVMKTLTIMGRLVDNQGRPLGGASVINHAGRTVTESDGMFTLELHEKEPVIRIEHPSMTQCEIRLDPETKKRDSLIFAGNVACGKTTLADNQTPTEGKKG